MHVSRAEFEAQAGRRAADDQLSRVHVSRAEFEGKPAGTLPTISCPECGVPTIARDDGFLCLDCVRATYDWRAPLEGAPEEAP